MVMSLSKETCSSCGIVFCAGALAFNGAALQMSFGVYYVEYLNYFNNSSERNLAWIIAVGTFVIGISGFVNAKIIQRVGYTIGGIAGSILASFGFLLCVFVDSTLLLLIGYGIITGIGSSLIYISYNVAVQTNFTKRRALASGATGVGSSIGMFVTPMLVRWLCDTYSWRGSMLIQAGIFLQGIVLSMILRIISVSKEVETIPSPKSALRPRYICTKDRWNSYLDIQLLANISLYAIIPAVCFGLMNMILYTSFTVAQYTSYGELKWKAALLVTLVGAGNIPGRLLFGWIGDKCNRLLLYGVLVCGCGSVTIIGSCFSNYYLQAGVSLSLGFQVGGAVALYGPALIDVYGLEDFSKVLGLVMVFSSIASLIPTPIAGWYIEKTGNYHHVFLVSGCLNAAVGILPIILALKLRRQKQTQKNENNQNVNFSPVSTKDVQLNSTI